MDAYQTRHGSPPQMLTLSLAAWILFYLGRFPQAGQLPARDTPEILGIFAELQSVTDPEALAAAVLTDARLWGRSIDSPVLRTALAATLRTLGAQLEAGYDLPTLLAVEG
ncbi:MAG: hypothetical protein EOP02_19395 [Proteobacteria bacterium]|nr:MAG: hypothetical protein EOP02_19395 [Pseudomonadota bacterium]